MIILFKDCHVYKFLPSPHIGKVDSFQIPILPFIVFSSYSHLILLSFFFSLLLLLLLLLLLNINITLNIIIYDNNILNYSYYY